MAANELFHATKRLKEGIEWLHDAKYFDKVDSTQKRVIQFLPKAAEGAILIMADTQSRGVGRQGRTWFSPTGGIWMTLALPMQKIDVVKAAAFSSVASLLLVDSLREVNNLKCHVKWPNDVLYDGKKVAGILVSTTKKFRKNWFLLGIGVNVNNDLPAELKNTATSIRAIRGQTQGRTRLIESVLHSVWTAWEEFDKTGFGPYQIRVQTVMSGIGQPVKIQMGTEQVNGVLEGLDIGGGIHVKVGSQSRLVQAGEVVS